jgi:hypothetical protein
MGKSHFEYGFEFAEKIEIIVEMYGFQGLIETEEAASAVSYRPPK